MDYLFALFCHQIAERSPSLAGDVFPVCYRCAGTYLGILLSSLYVVATGGWRRGLPTVPVLIVASALMVPFLIDGWANTIGWWNTPNLPRAFTGLAYGTVIPLILLPLASLPFGTRALEDALHRDPTLRSPLELVVPLGLGATLLLILDRTDSPAVFQGLAVAVSVGFLSFVSTFSFAITRIPFVRERLTRRSSTG